METSRWTRIPSIGLVNVENTEQWSFSEHRERKRRHQMSCDWIRLDQLTKGRESEKGNKEEKHCHAGIYPSTVLSTDSRFVETHTETSTSGIRRFESSLLGKDRSFSCFGLDIWVEIFLWCFMTSIVVYFIASIVAIRALRSHKIGRWYAVLILLAGITTPMLSSAITSTFGSSPEPLSICLFSFIGALLSAMFYAASVEIRPFFCFVLGVGQTGVVLFFSFLKILSTL